MFLNNYQAVCLPPLPTVKMPDIISSIVAETLGPTPASPVVSSWWDFSILRTEDQGENQAGRQEVKLWEIHSTSLFFVHKNQCRSMALSHRVSERPYLSVFVDAWENLQIRNPNLYHKLISYLFICRRPPPHPPPPTWSPGPFLMFAALFLQHMLESKG